MITEKLNLLLNNVNLNENIFCLLYDLLPTTSKKW